jgi:hypothetical protein
MKQRRSKEAATDAKEKLRIRARHRLLLRIALPLRHGIALFFCLLFFVCSFSA